MKVSSPAGCKRRNWFTVLDCLSAPIKPVALGWRRCTTLPKATWMKMMWCCWTPGRRWESFVSVAASKRVKNLLYGADLFLYFWLCSALLVDWKTRQQVWNNRCMEERTGVPEVSPGRPGPGYAHYFHQAGKRAPYLHWLVWCMGPPEVESEFKSWSF